MKEMTMFFIQKGFRCSVIQFIILVWGLPDIARGDSADCDFVVPKQAVATATSTLEEKGRPKSAYSAIKAFDGDLATAWCEGNPNEGIGVILTAELKPQAAHGIVLLNGFGKHRSTYLANNRVQKYVLTITDELGKTYELNGALSDDICWNPTVDDELSAKAACKKEPSADKESDCMRKYQDMCIMDILQSGQNIKFIEPLCIRSIRFEINSVFKGAKHNDTCIAEMRLFEDFYPSDGKKLAGICK